MDVEVLRTGSRGVFVEELQRLLNKKLPHRTPLEPDGIFGSLTRQAVIAYQRAQWLTPDGVVGPCTWSALKDWETIHIDWPVRLIPQPTEDTCWAAATGMLLNRGGPVRAPAGMDVDGGLLNDSGTNDAANMTRFARAFNLTLVHGQSWTVAGFAQLMRARGPLMLNILWNDRAYASGRDSPGHMVVVSGMRGVEMPNAATLRVHDPAPVGRGTIDAVIYGPYMRRYPTSTYQILHR